ncbi:hypothetical protein HanXRQr2_Chr13g0608451 [Helianthus annuus]|uniref:UDP-glucuronosyl/UDP-glucosyltransferase n=1 Tax=Helianthus annuus TaxID=4232 RepID=A0A9K3HE17_HELAN|nr:hypothetical protein HanXRQr2_Chr13g0608451 [Helianthus annuus]
MILHSLQSSNSKTFFQTKKEIKQDGNNNQSMWFGVPMAAWPIYAEQQMNAFEMVVELGLGVEIKLDYKKDMYNPKNDIVTTEEIESGIRRLMDDDEMREKMKDMGNMSRLTVRKGGSSYASVGLLIQDFIGNA